MKSILYGIGHAMVDFFCFFPDTFLDSENDAFYSLPAPLEEGKACHVSSIAFDQILADFAQRGFIPGGSHRFEKSSGGTAVNILKSATRCGLQGCFVGTMGCSADGVRDNEAVFFQKELAHSGVMAHIHTEIGASGRCLIVHHPSCDTSGTVTTPVVTTTIAASPSVARCISLEHVIQLQDEIRAHAYGIVIEGMLLSNNEVLEAVVSLCQQHDCILVLDIASNFAAHLVVSVFDSIVNRVPLIVFANEAEAALCADSFAPYKDASSDTDFPLIVETYGAHGAVAWSHGQVYRAPISEADTTYTATHTILDATGTGDTFAGAFLAEFFSNAGTPHENIDITQCLECGNQAAQKVLYVAGTNL